MCGCVENARVGDASCTEPPSASVYDLQVMDTATVLGEQPVVPLLPAVDVCAQKDRRFKPRSNQLLDGGGDQSVEHRDRCHTRRRCEFLRHPVSFKDCVPLRDLVVEDDVTDILE